MAQTIFKRCEKKFLLTEGQYQAVKPLIERYAMLKNLRDDLLVDGVDVGGYSESAFRKTRPEEDAQQ